MLLNIKKKKVMPQNTKKRLDNRKIYCKRNKTNKTNIDKTNTDNTRHVKNYNYMITVGWLHKPYFVCQKIFEKRIKKIRRVSLQTNISNMPFDDRSPRNPKKGVLYGHKQTHIVTLT